MLENQYVLERYSFGWPDSIPSVGQIPIRQLSKLKKNKNIIPEKC